MYILKVKDQEYKCKLTMENSILLERKLKMNPLMIFKDESLPPITTMVAVLHASLQEYNHGINEEKALKIFSQWVEEHSVVEFVKVLMDIFKDGGYIKSEEEDEEVDEDEKN